MSAPAAFLSYILKISKFLCAPVIVVFLMSLPATRDQDLVDEIVAKLYLAQPQAARELVKKLTDIDARSSSGSPLLVAMAQVPGLNDGTLYDQVFERHPDCNLRDKTGMTALYFAASVGNMELVERLLKGGADANLSSDEYGSALVGAVWNNRGAIARRLLVVPGIKVDLADRHGRTALIFAVIHGDLELVRELIRKGANPNVYEIVTGNTPLIWSSAGSKDLVAFLLDSHADSRLPNPFNCQTVIHAAVTANNIDVVRLLLQRDITASFADSQGRTPLGIARSQRHVEVSELLKTTLESRGMNTSETAVPPTNCHNDLLVTYARPVQIASKSQDEEEFVPFAKTVIQSWESKNNIFVNPDVPEFTGRQITLFEQIICDPRNNPDTLSKCKALLANKIKLKNLVTKNLDTTFIEKQKTTTWLAADLANSIGIDFARAGYTVHGPNQIACSQLPKDFGHIRGLFFDGEFFLELQPGVTLCLRKGSYQVLIPSSHVVLKMNFYSNDTNPMTNVTVAPMGPDTVDTANRILPPLQFVSLRGETSESPLTLPLPLRDDVRIAAPKSFSTTTSIQVSVKDDSGICLKACQIAVRVLLIKAVAVWRMGCTRCSLANLLVIRFPDATYFSAQTVDILRGYLSANRQWPRGDERPPLQDSRLFSGYERLDGSNPRVSELCAAHIPAPFDQLCPNHAELNSMKVVLEISKESTTCFTPNAIACASPDGTIQLRAYDHAFTTNEAPGLRSVRFGAGPQEFNLLAVLIHELGHFFGLPHLDETTPKIEGRSDVMLPAYNPNGFWVTKADYAILNKAVDPEWPYRLSGCAGLRY